MLFFMKISGFMLLNKKKIDKKEPLKVNYSVFIYFISGLSSYFKNL